MAGRLKIYNNSTSTWEYIGGYGKAMPAGDVVGTSDTQTLTNKTLTSPVINQFGTASGLGAAWTSWEPTVTNWTQGNGTKAGGYVQLGKVIHFWGLLGFGSSGSSVGGALTLTLPVTISADLGAITPIGVAHFYDASGTYYTGIIWSNGAIYVQGASATYVNLAAISSSVPMTWASGDYLAFSGTYEAA